MSSRHNMEMRYRERVPWIDLRKRNHVLSAAAVDVAIERPGGQVVDGVLVRVAGHRAPRSYR